MHQWQMCGLKHEWYPCLELVWCTNHWPGALVAGALVVDLTGVLVAGALAVGSTGALVIGALVAGSLKGSLVGLLVGGEDEGAAVEGRPVVGLAVGVLVVGLLLGARVGTQVGFEVVGLQVVGSCRSSGRLSSCGATSCWFGQGHCSGLRSPWSSSRIQA